MRPRVAAARGLALAALLAAGVACGKAGGGAMPRRPLDEVLAAHADSLLALPGVTGVAAGRCEGMPCVRVFVTAATPELRRRVPRELEGYPVRMEVTGPFRPRGAPAR